MKLLDKFKNEVVHGGQSSPATKSEGSARENDSFVLDSKKQEKASEV
jgi:hypothetical protein